jgi:microcystin-dependent protein
MPNNRRDYAGAAATSALANAITMSDTVITLTATSGWPTGTNGPFAIVIDEGTAAEEKVLVTSRSGTTLTISQRGYDGTTASAHSTGASVKHCFTAIDADEANYWAAELAGAANASGDLILADGPDSLTGLAKGANSTLLQIDSGGTIKWGTAQTAMIADNAITAAKIATAVAGDGLTGGGGSALAVNVDGSTLEIVSDTVRIKDAGVGAAKIAANAVTAAKIDPAVAGNGLTGGGGSALAVNVDGSTLEIVSDTVRIKDDGVTLAKLAAAVQEMLVPTGTILAYGGSTAPTGFLLCFGQAVSRTTYAALFNVIGTTFGAGDGSTTFNLPDLRGRVAVGKDNMGGTAANRITSAVSGINGTVLGAAGGDQRLHQHNHGVTDPGHLHSFNSGVGAGIFGVSLNAAVEGTANTNSATTGITINNAGNGASQNVQPSIILNAIIKT